MIRYSLVCSDAHEFECWFRDMASFDDQAANETLICPFCQSREIQKSVMAPHVARSGVASPSATPKQTDAVTPAGASSPFGDAHRELRAAVRELRDKIIAATEDVGDRFGAEARRIYEGESEPRPIRGAVSPSEAKALIEDGVPILPLPGEGH